MHKVDSVAPTCIICSPQRRTGGRGGDYINAVAWPACLVHNCMKYDKFFLGKENISPEVIYLAKFSLSFSPNIYFQNFCTPFHLTVHHKYFMQLRKLNVL